MNNIIDFYINGKVAIGNWLMSNENTLKEEWTRVSSRSSTKHFLFICCGATGGSNTFWELIGFTVETGFNGTSS
jgi:hypothetical protein